MTIRPALPPATRPSNEQDLTPQQMDLIRQKEYGHMGLKVETYRYPLGAELVIELYGRKVPLLSPFVTGMMQRDVKVRIRKLVDTYPEAVIYVTMPSKYTPTIIINNPTKGV